MSRRSLLLVAFSFASLTLAACSDVTAPTPSGRNQLAPSGQVNHDVCPGGYSTSSGRTC
jgi:hypothetical protein